MATEVGVGYISLVPSMRGFSQKTQAELSRANLGGRLSADLARGATDAGTRSGGLFSRAFSQATRRSTATNFPGPSASLLRNIRTYAFAVSAVGGLTVGLGLKTASSMEQAQVAFTTMLGSAEKAKTFLASLVQFAQTTPFDLPGVVTASQKLLAFGFTAKDTLPTLTALGDAAAGLSLGAEGLDRLTTAIGQIQAKGRVQSDELLQLTEAGVPALKILANQFGITTATAQALVTKGLIPANKAVPALLQGLETGTNGLAGQTARFGGLMAQQSHTLGGILSNLRDTVSQGLAKAVAPLLPVLEQQIPRAMNRLPGLFSAAATGMRDFLTGLGLVADQTPGAASGFEQFGSIVASAAGALKAVFGFIADHSALFKMLAVEILGSIVAVKAFNIAMSLTSGPGGGVGLLIAAVGALAGAFIYSWKTSETFRNVVTGVFSAVGRIAVTFAQGMYDILAAPFKAVFKVVASLPHVLVGPVKGMAQSALNGLNSVDHGLASTNAWLDELSKPRAVRITFSSSFVGPLAPNEKRGKPVKLPSTFAGPLAPGETRAALPKPLPAIPKSTFSLGKTATDALAKGVKAPKVKVAQSATEIADAILQPLRDLRQKAADLGKGIADAITGSTGLGSLTTQTDILGNQVKQSLGGLIRGLVAQRAQVLAFRQELKTLGKRGLDGTDINQIAGLGLQEGGGLAKTLMGATGAQLKQISSLTGGIRSGASLIGQDRASATFGAQISAEVSRTRTALERKLDDTSLSKKTVADVERAMTSAVKSVRVYTNLVDMDQKQGRRTLTALGR